MSALTDLFTGIANAIRGKTGGTDAITASDFASAIAGLPTGATHAAFTVTGNSTKSATIPELIGKTQVVGFATNYTTGSRTITFAVTDDITGDNYGGNWSTGNMTWDSETGTITTTHYALQAADWHIWGW